MVFRYKKPSKICNLWVCVCVFFLGGPSMCVCVCSSPGILNKQIHVYLTMFGDV